MNLLLPCAILLAAFLTAAHADDAIQWGDPANGLRLGLTRPAAADITSGDNPAFTITAQNVSSHAITIPAPDGFVLKANPDSSDFHELPLTPLIRDTHPGTGGPNVRYNSPTYSIHNGYAVELSPPHVQTLAAGQSVTWSGIPLDKSSYAGDRLPPGDSRSIQQWYLLPSRSYDIQFQFANEQANVNKTAVWTGKAISGVVRISVKPPSLDGYKITGQFTLPKQNYFIGEPIVATFTAANEGDAAIQFPYGGDYRSTGRPERFTITAVDANGKAVPDPVTPGGMGGGLGSSHEIKPGESYTTQLMVNHWCAFTAPGDYTITCKRTLNVIRSDQRKEDYYSLPEITFPAIPIESKLKVTIRDDPAALQSYLQQLMPNLQLEPSPLRESKVYEEFLCLALARNASAFSIMESFLDGPPDVQQTVVPWICLYPTEKVAPILAAHFPKLSSPARVAALATMRDWPAAQAEPMILASLKSTDARERAVAVEACWKTVSPACFSTILEMADDPDPLVRRYRTSVLGQNGDPRAIPALLSSLRDPDAEARVWAAGELGKKKRKEGVPVLIAILRGRQLASMDGNVIEALQQSTGQNLGYDRKRWLDWWKTSGEAQYGKAPSQL